MASFSTNEFKSGLKIILDNDPYSIVENEMVKPGKGQAFNRVKVRNLKTGRVIERTFNNERVIERQANESIEVIKTAPGADEALPPAIRDGVLSAIDGLRIGSGSSAGERP